MTSKLSLKVLSGIRYKVISYVLKLDNMDITITVASVRRCYGQSHERGRYLSDICNIASETFHKSTFLFARKESV